MRKSSGATVVTTLKVTHDSPPLNKIIEFTSAPIPLLLMRFPLFAVFCVIVYYKIIAYFDSNPRHYFSLILPFLPLQDYALFKW